MAADTIVGPDRVGHRSIACRRCAADCSRRVDGTWRHDHDGTVLDGTADRCPSPDQVRARADATG